MRIRRWEEEEEFDRYMRDRAAESGAAAEPGLFNEVVARVGAGLRDACGQAVSGASLCLALLRVAAARPMLSAPGGPSCEARL